ncbi:HAD family hydrolase [Thermostaphylospora chromogena]|uniref:HAD family hydrolase n=1 Tax=Thermostaphylospora chromogena TaxID=35622 RepID=UPI001F5FF96F|nr:haloacid dehalogenase-like hydrolase [Thermostaphylospora chromogena]
MQRLALFDLDDTLVDLDAAFAVRAAEFAGAHGLGQQAVDWLVALNRQGYPHREVFFAKVREHFALAEPVEELWRWYRRRMPYLVRCRPEVMEGLARLRADGWKVGIVTNGTANSSRPVWLRRSTAVRCRGWRGCANLIPGCLRSRPSGVV